MDHLISNLLSKLIFDNGKWSNWKYANTQSCVFSCLTTSQSQKLIPKADLRRSIFLFKKILSRVLVNIKKVNQWISNCILKSDVTGVWYMFWRNKFMKKLLFITHPFWMSFCALFIVAWVLDLTVLLFISFLTVFSEFTVSSY